MEGSEEWAGGAPNLLCAGIPCSSWGWGASRALGKSEWRKGRTQTPDSRLSRHLGVLPPCTVSPGFCFVDTGEKYLECLPFCIVTTLLLHPSVDNQELTLIHGKIVKTLLSHYDAV